MSPDNLHLLGTDAADLQGDLPTSAQRSQYITLASKCLTDLETSESCAPASAGLRVGNQPTQGARTRHSREALGAPLSSYPEILITTIKQLTGMGLLGGIAP